MSSSPQKWVNHLNQIRNRGYLLWWLGYLLEWWGFLFNWLGYLLEWWGFLFNCRGYLLRWRGYLLVRRGYLPEWWGLLLGGWSFVLQNIISEVDYHNILYISGSKCLKSFRDLRMFTS